MCLAKTGPTLCFGCCIYFAKVKLYLLLCLLMITLLKILRMAQEVTCNKCESSQITVQKKGFSGKNSFVGFLCMAIVVGIIWALLIRNQTWENQINNSVYEITRVSYTPVNYTENKALWLATAFLLASSFLFGFQGANDNQIVCLKCGNIQPIGENKEAKS